MAHQDRMVFRVFRGQLDQLAQKVIMALMVRRGSKALLVHRGRQVLLARMVPMV